MRLHAFAKVPSVAPSLPNGDTMEKSIQGVVRHVTDYRVQAHSTVASEARVPNV